MVGFNELWHDNPKINAQLLKLLLSFRTPKKNPIWKIVTFTYTHKTTTIRTKAAIHNRKITHTREKKKTSNSLPSEIHFSVFITQQPTIQTNNKKIKLTLINDQKQPQKWFKSILWPFSHFNHGSKTKDWQNNGSQI